MSDSPHPQPLPAVREVEVRRAGRASRSTVPSGSGAASRSLLAGGTEGNERLTVQTGAVLFVALAVLGVTIIRIGQLTWLHLFLGLALIGPVVLKLASTGYRFLRYYTGDHPYRLKGAPPWPLRLMGPVLVLSTLGIFVTGIVLLALGPGARQPWMLLHKVSFFIWLAVASLHVLGHLPEIRRGLLQGRKVRGEVLAIAGEDAPRSTPASRGALAGRVWVAGYTLAAPRPGRSGRAVSLGLALAGGLILAAVLIPDFAPWVGDHRRFASGH
jgi:hypothetical protein